MNGYHIAAVDLPPAGGDPGSIAVAFEATAALDNRHSRRMIGSHDVDRPGSEGLHY
ncbi:hypothetical protein [Aestuariimicrobium ganziense]|uniref:hypothetical protein n=1 Tax=Aestuariimicrobium ganziense TaxID=2773677 RepID=UPI0019409ADC|nr:hypothetical protein [Aestuariimicrobium ganziense]